MKFEKVTIETNINFVLFSWRSHLIKLLKDKRQIKRQKVLKLFKAFETYKNPFFSIPKILIFQNRSTDNDHFMMNTMDLATQKITILDLDDPKNNDAEEGVLICFNFQKQYKNIDFSKIMNLLSRKQKILKRIDMLLKNFKA